MEDIFYKLFEVNYGSLIVLLVFAYGIFEWGKMIISKSYKFPLKEHYPLSEVDIRIAEYLIEHMKGREFEKFCAWLFRKSGKYKSVELTQAVADGGKDIILNGDTYVECKRYSEGNGEYSTLEIGREICQKLVGAMVADGIKKGIIVTTGLIHKNAWEYLKSIEKNTDLELEFMIFDELIRMVREINSDEVLEKIISFKDETEVVTE
jgi:restriction system protein